MVIALSLLLRAGLRLGLQDWSQVCTAPNENHKLSKYLCFGLPSFAARHYCALCAAVRSGEG
jgi:hypothetical protein